MRLLVTGGRGYLGRELLRRAPARGWDVRATWMEQAPHGDDAEWVRCDVRSAEQVTSAMREVDAIIHTAYRPGALAWETNAEGSAVVARAADGRRLILLSTDQVFSGTRGRYREEDEVGPVNAYGRSKAEAERRVASIHPQATIARTALIYGGDEPGAQERLALEHSRFFVDEFRSPVQVGDLANALLDLLEIEWPGPLHLGGAHDVSRFDFAVLLGADPARIEPAHTTPDRAPLATLDSARAASLLPTRLRGVHEVLGG